VPRPLRGDDDRLRVVAAEAEVGRLGLGGCQVPRVVDFGTCEENNGSFDVELQVVECPKCRNIAEDVEFILNPLGSQNIFYVFSTLIGRFKFLLLITITRTYVIKMALYDS
jgi:hypothetical protein